MGSDENGTPPKSSKPPSPTQEAHTMPAYPDWSSSMQPFYGVGATPPFLATTAVSSPTLHPFLWGGQHHPVPPYGTPVYPMYPPGGVYAHPNMVMDSANVNGNAELEGKATVGKDCVPSKQAMGNLGNHGLVGAKLIDGGKATSGSGNDVGTQSADSGSEGSSDASDDNNQNFSKANNGSFDQRLADGANPQNNGIHPNLQTSVAGNPVVSVPTTNLNVGMDLWNGSGLNRAGVSPTVVAPSGVMSDQWVQDERELKRQKRKQSNRESARRSRLRKQAECEDLQLRVDKLSNENHTLRDELQRLSDDCDKLSSENISIKEELTNLYGSDALSKLKEGSC